MATRMMGFLHLSSGPVDDFGPGNFAMTTGYLEAPTPGECLALPRSQAACALCKSPKPYGQRMSVSLEAAEQEIATALNQVGLSLPAALLAACIATKAPARPEDEVVAIITQ